MSPSLLLASLSLPTLKPTQRADKPGQMTLTKIASLQTDGMFRNTYTVAFFTEVTGQEVLDEV